MNFPMEWPIFQFFYWLVNTPGYGGLVVALVGAGSVVAYALTLRWIQLPPPPEETEIYTYPTPALHHDLENGPHRPSGG